MATALRRASRGGSAEAAKPLPRACGEGASMGEGLCCVSSALPCAASSYSVASLELKSHVVGGWGIVDADWLEHNLTSRIRVTWRCKVVLKVLAALIIGGMVVGASAAKSQQFVRVPDYCVDFSSDACQRIKDVVEKGIRPAFCVPGFGRADSPIRLSPEQLRICYAMPSPISSDDKRQLDNFEAQRRQRIEDARAMVRENWTQYCS